MEKGVAEGKGCFTTVLGKKIVGVWSEGVLQRRPTLPSESSFSSHS